jgi:hypothetical protein
MLQPADRLPATRTLLISEHAINEHDHQGILNPGSITYQRPFADILNF